MTACSAQPATQAAPSPTTTTTSTTSAAPTTTTGAGARLGTPRKVLGVDPCGLLLPEDFNGVGPLVQAPFMHADFPGMCIYQVGEDVPTDLIVMVGFEESYEQVHARYPGGFEKFTDNHSTLTICGRDTNTDAWCTAWVAVADGATLTVSVRLPKANVDQVASILGRRVAAALKRVPVE
ncbi:MAG: DUF3558 family protein [Umezawaea sp.]